jgi:hypothetical protein
MLVLLLGGMEVGRRFWWVGGGRRFFECGDCFERCLNVDIGLKDRFEIETSLV